MSNTPIDSMYRDGANWKAWDHIVVAGTLTCAGVRPFLIDGLWFTPADVGLTHPGVALAGFPNEDDHSWCEITPESFEPCDGPPQMDAPTLLARFAATAPPRRSAR